ncbi:hypothetical protein ACFL3S_12715, partial [Gemmatimonadota bacterium]
PGAVLALSGAMPGLVGATMRRGGYYSRMREGISHSGSDAAGGTAAGEAEEADRGGEGNLVIVKLFNRPLADLAETLAARPLLVRADHVEGLDSGAAEGGWIRLAGRDPGATDGDWVRLAVTLA